MIRVLGASRATRFLAYGAALILTVFVASAAFERLVESRMMPESFLLEFGIFAALWFVGDRVAGRLFRASLLPLLLERRRAFARLLALLAAVSIACVWFRFGSFTAEFAAFALLWALLDRGLSTVVN